VQTCDAPPLAAPGIGRNRLETRDATELGGAGVVAGAGESIGAMAAGTSGRPEDCDNGGWRYGSGGGGGGGAGGGGGGRAAEVGGDSGAMTAGTGGHQPGGPPEENNDDADAAAPSELLAPLLEEWREVLVKHVLSRLDPTDCALLGQVAKPWLAVLVANNLPRAGKGGAVPLRLERFSGCVEALAWAKDNGCPWDSRTSLEAAAGGQLEVLKWVREHECPWDAGACAEAAYGGHLEVLVWAREHDCPWNVETCASAAAGGQLAVLQWARAHGCPWDEETCAYAAQFGHLDVLRWAREHDCPWANEDICDWAAKGGYLEMLQWAREQHCPWDEWTCAYAAKGGHLEVLRWAREHGCQWDGRTVKAVLESQCAEASLSETMAYVRANGCPTEYIDEINDDENSGGEELSDAEVSEYDEWTGIHHVEGA